MRIYLKIARIISFRKPSGLSLSFCALLFVSQMDLRTHCSPLSPFLTRESCKIRSFMREEPARVLRIQIFLDGLIKAYATAAMMVQEVFHFRVHHVRALSGFTNDATTHSVRWIDHMDGRGVSVALFGP